MQQNVKMQIPSFLQKLFTTSKTNFILQYINDAMLILNLPNLEVITTHKFLNKVVWKLLRWRWGGGWGLEYINNQTSKGLFEVFWPLLYRKKQDFL